MTTTKTTWAVEIEGMAEAGWTLTVVPAEFPTRQAAERFADGCRAARPDATVRVVRN